MDKIDIKKPIIRSPKSTNNLSKSLKSKLKGDINLKQKPTSTNTQTKFKKIKLTPKSSSKKVQSKLFIPTELSVKPVENKPIEKSKDVPKLDIKVESIVNKSEVVKPTLEPTVTEVKSTVNEIKPSVDKVKSTVDKVKKSKKLNKRRLSRRKKSSKNKVVSVDLNNNNSTKEKDIIEIINKFEKMNIKEIKTFLKNKGIDSKNNSKSKLMPYLYLLTCVDNDINVIKS